MVMVLDVLNLLSKVGVICDRKGLLIS